MDIVQTKYQQLCNTPSDIYEHLPTLYKYASECNSIAELGVRGCVSSWAFVNGLLHNNQSSRRIVLNDITPCDIRELLDACKNLPIDIHYEWINDLDMNMDQPVDITFIDTWHVYAQLKRELYKFSKVTNKYIIMHDTTVDEIHGETVRAGWDPVQQSVETVFPIHEITCGLWPAVTDFLATNPSWKLKERFTNNNGLTILEKIE